MIKNFEEYINEDYFSKLANRKDNCNKRKENEVTEELVRSFVHKSYEKLIKSINIRKENGETVVDIDGDFYLSKDVEEIPFQFGKVTGDFNCSYCEKLKSIKGCPKEVRGYFDCSFCKKLTSLEGCPKEVGVYFVCENCKKLTSLKGCPEKVGGYFECSYCKHLKSLEGCPKEVGGNFYCKQCGKKFTEEEIKSVCDVKGEIAV